MKAKTITEKLRIDDRVETTATKEAFITLKDHKDNFENKPTCRLINPSKQEIGKISKQILDSINKKLLNATRVNQWKNTSSVLQWFKQLPNKQRCAFITFDVVEFYAKNNPRITVEANKKVVNFLDVTLDLTTEKYKPYSKPATTPLYVHSKSNHPPCIIKNIPEAINKRLSEISSDEEAFKEAAPPYQEALQKSGYSYTLKFTPPQQSPKSTTHKRKRQRNIIWFNPPFSKNVQTNIGREFRNLIQRCFPPNHKLRKLFNKNNLKLSYSCSPNIKQIIDGHNKTIIKPEHTTSTTNTHQTLQLQSTRQMPFERTMLSQGSSVSSHHHDRRKHRDVRRPHRH